VNMQFNPKILLLFCLFLGNFAYGQIPLTFPDSETTPEETSVDIKILDNDVDLTGFNVATIDLDPGQGGQQLTFTDPAKGTYTVDGSGVVTFLPVLNFFGTSNAQYTVENTLGVQSGATDITITVTAVNDPPSAAADNASTNEDANVSVQVTANDADIDGTIAVATVDLNPSTPARDITFSTTGGIFTADNSGFITFAPDQNYNGPASVTYTVEDNDGGLSNVTTFSVTVTAVNDVPVANDDAATTIEDSSVIIDIDANDTDVEGPVDPASVDMNVSLAGQQTTHATSEGVYVSDGTGNVTFTPDLNFNGTAAVEYTIEDGDGATSLPATITVTVTAVNDPPVAVDDAASTNEGVQVSLNVLTNDTDPESNINPASVDLDISTPLIQNSITTGDGDWNVNAIGLVTFDPDPDFAGMATLDYTVNDLAGAISNAATISITVNSVNDPPVANSDATTTNEDTDVTLNVVANDTDIDGTINSASVDMDPATSGKQTTIAVTGGTFTVANTGIVTFAPTLNFFGASTATYTVEDNNGATSNSTTITVTVSSVNDPPVAQNDATTTAEDTPAAINVLANDSDIDGTLSASTLDLDTSLPGAQNTSTIAAGTFTITSPGTVTFTPATDFNGSATISYTVNDNGGATSNQATITITVTALNDAPVAVNDATSTNEDTSVTLNIVSNDTDADGTVNVASVDLNPATSTIDNSHTTAAGNFSVSNLGIVSFTPALNFTGTATLNYTVNDNNGATSNQAQISITVTPVNDTPVAVNDATSTNEDVAVNLNVVANDTDVDGTVVASTVDFNSSLAGIQNTITTTAGTFTAGPTGIVNFVPSASFNGSATAQYTVQDNNGATSNSATITITVTSVNDAPIAVDDATTTNEDAIVTLNVVSNDTDEDGTINVGTVDLNITLAGIQNNNSNASGSFAVDGSGIVTYTPTLNFNGTATMLYRVNDNSGATSNAATIAITVNAINDAPHAVNDAVSTNEDVAVNLNIVSNDTDVDGTINIATVDLNPTMAGTQTNVSISGGTVSVSVTGVVTFTPTVNFYGIATCPYTVNDNSGALSNTGTITFTVNAVNDPPIANNDITSADENETVSLNVITNDIDIDGTINAGTIDLNPASPGIQSTRNVTGGTFTAAPTGIVTFTPNLNFNGIATVNYSVQDDAGATSNAASITVTVNSINSDPVANNDATTTNEDVAVSFNITTNDTDADGTINAATVDLDPATAGTQANRTTTEGVYNVSSTGLVTFTPTTNFHGTSAITYTVNDNVGATSNAATITVTVTSINDLPVANNDATTTTESVPVNLTVVTNDTDVDGTIDVSTVDLNTTLAGIQDNNTTTGGAFTVSNLGVVTFTPNGTFSGVTTLGYRVNDNSGGTSNTATISITVTAVNDPPVANNDAATTTEDVAVTLNVVANDTDEDGTISASTVDLIPSTPGPNNSVSTTQGTFVVNASGIVTFTPTLNFNGTASTPYTVNDNGGLTSNEATITITVTPVNDAPLAVNDVLSTTEDQAGSVNIIANDSDVDGTIDLSTIDLNTALGGVQNVHSVPGGTFTTNIATGLVTFTPTPNFSGTFNLPYRVSDNNGLVSNQASIAVTVTAVNDPPTFTKIDTVKIFKNSGQKVVTITGISPGPSESEPMLLTATSGNTSLIPNPTVTHTPNTASTATLSFTPVPTKFGTAEITVKLVDSGLNEYTQIFIVQVIEVKISSQPILVATVSVPYSYAIKTQVSPEAEKDVAYEVSVLTKPSWLTLTGPSKDKTLAGVPPNNAAATNTIRLQVKSGAFLLDEQIYTLTINKAPVITTFVIQATEDVLRPFTQQEFLDAYEDGNDDPLTRIKIVSLPQRGDLKLNGSAVVVDQEINFSAIPGLTYLSDLDSSGADSFSWKASDGYSFSEPANININVAPVNDGPRIVTLETDSLEYEVGSNVPVLLTELFTAEDPDDDFLTGGQVGFRSINYKPSVDILIFTNTTKISGDFDDQSGILTLTGIATVDEYEEAIKTIQYNFEAGESGENKKGVFFSLTDGKTQGAAKDRGIKLISTYQDPDIPNVFSPDGNGVNDSWAITGKDDQLAKAEIRVFNRRGTLVYEATGLEKLWDGTLNGTALPADTYYYTIDVKFNNKLYKGSVTILR
jgi:gliding motility-associated-like protein